VEEGAKVIIADINDSNGQAVADSLGAPARFVHTDVSRGDDMVCMVAAAMDSFGGLDILVNNAGFTHRNGPMLDVTEEEIDRIHAVNVKSLYYGAKSAVPVFRERGGGVILNIASTAGVRPRPGLVWYNGSKGAVITITKSMAVELAPDSIRVCALNPVAGETGMLHLFMGADTPERRRQFVSTIPLGRFSTPRDVADSALFLCSDEAQFLTGVCLEVDGGRCI
jgi:3-oxoacyl-[acyl-carrier protein] reductase